MQNIPANLTRGPSLRILYMPPVYALISFFSYRYFRDYTYYDLVETGACPPTDGAPPSRH